jgi:hypothetical protein
VENFPEFVALVFDGGELLFGEGSDADELIGLEDFDNTVEVFEAGFFDRLHAVARELVGSEVSTSILHPNEGAKVGDKMVLEKVIGGVEEFGEESPEAAA